MLNPSTNAGVVKQVDTVDSKSTGSNLMSVRVRPPVLSLIRLLFFALLCVAPHHSLTAESGIVAVEILGGEGQPFWSHRMRDPYLKQLQDETLLRSLTSQNLNRTLLELNRIRRQQPLVRSATGRISFLSSIEDWFAFGFTTTGSFARASNLPPEQSAEYYNQLKAKNRDFLYPERSQEFLAEILFNQQKRSLQLSPNFMLSADLWIRPEKWYVRPFLRAGISAPVEENTANGLFASSTGMEFALSDRTIWFIVEGYADAYRVLWEDYTRLKKDATVWDTGWRAGFALRF